MLVNGKNEILRVKFLSSVRLLAVSLKNSKLEKILHFSCEENVKSQQNSHPKIYCQQLDVIFL